MNADSDFQLDARLKADTAFIVDLPICRVLLMNNSHFPWLILVPRLNEAVELTEVSESDYLHIMQEVRRVTRTMQRALTLTPTKMNIATLGNQVRQLHMHIVARYSDDAAWPNPVWGGASTPYSPEEQKAQVALFQALLSE